MTFCRKYFNRYLAVSWLVLAVLLIQIVFPLYFHLHHDLNAEAGEHVHIIDSHLLTDKQASEHLADEDTRILKTTPDVINKQNTDTGFVIALMLCLLIVLAVKRPLVIRLRQLKQNNHCHFFYYDLAPPLRAPPAS